MPEKTVCIIGAGPAGLTAALELQSIDSSVKILLFEKTSDIGGLSKTVNFKGNRIDIGGHRFFSKSDKVMQTWLALMPLENTHQPDENIMLLRKRLSRILFLRKFFDYPLRLSISTLSNLGVIKTITIGLSYLMAQCFPVKPEITLEDFFINRFGKTLYSIFFKDYTEKVWGVTCKDIPKEWGAQRVKGLSITKVIWHAISKCLRQQALSQKDLETSLIEQFLYPKYGPGNYWVQAANIIKSNGGTILLNKKVVGIKIDNHKAKQVIVFDTNTGQEEVIETDAIFSSMPVQELIASFCTAPLEVNKVAQNLMYRDFITVGILVPKNKCINLPDNWIYIQEKDVSVGRVQIFNNWSPFMVKDMNHLWMGLEYFCNEGDSLWNQTDEDLKKLAAKELLAIGFIKNIYDVLDSTVVRMEKAYPAYFGGYEDFKIISDFTDNIENLYLIGRNGMHRYNNMDHSMLTAIEAVRLWTNNIPSKESIWNINSEEEYHEEKIQ